MQDSHGHPGWHRVRLQPQQGIWLAPNQPDWPELLVYLKFGCQPAVLAESFGPADAARQNFDGEVEYLYGGAIFRFQNGVFVECTFADTAAQRVRLQIGGTEILSVYHWLAAQADAVDRAYFRISKTLGVAYDRRHPEAASYTLFAPGHWDAVLN